MAVIITVHHPDGRVEVAENTAETTYCTPSESYEEEITTSVRRASAAMDSTARVIVELYPQAAQALESVADALAQDSDWKTASRLRTAAELLWPTEFRDE